MGKALPERYLSIGIALCIASVSYPPKELSAYLDIGQLK
jgi:hypothetical protein